ncbi:MAG: DUF3488 and transglutaminase-like domain-containing protein [Burkholderiaceae bacterium]
MKLPLPLPPARPMSRDKSDTLLLLFACLLVLAPHASHLPGRATLLCALLLAWRGWITLRGNRLPSHWLLLPLAALAMAGVWLHYRTLLGRDAGVTMLVLLLAFKLLEMRARRDLFVVLFLDFFVLLTGFFYSQSIAAALWMAAALVALLAAQISFQYTGAVPPLWQRLRLGATVFALAAPLALVFFVFFPRIQGPLWGLPSDAQAGRSGLSNRMEPGAISRLALSDDIAFRARFDGTPPPRAQRYWRGPVLGLYDGRAWSELRPPLATGQPPLFRSHAAPLRYQVTLEPHGQRWLFALEMPAAVPQIAGNPARFGEQRELLASQPITRRLRYDAVSYLDFELEPIESPLLLQPWLQLPPGRNPRTLELAHRLRRETDDGAQLAQQVLRYFRSEEFRYTLEPPPLGADGVDEFLFTTRAGFCEHYAGAFVVLMRAMDIPARVVTGYQGGDINPVDGFMTVRQSDAHAWAEIWLDGRGWTRVDPTAAVAPNRIELNLSGALPRPLLGGLLQLEAGERSWLARWQRLRAGWDAATNAWNQWVLNYGSDNQQALLRRLGIKEPDWPQLALLMALSASALLALMMAPQLLRRRKIDAADALYSALSRRMARHGLAREIHEGPRAWRRRLTAPQSPLPAATREAAAHFLQLYEALRYGPRRGDPAAERAAILSRLKTLLNRCR